MNIEIVLAIIKTIIKLVTFWYPWDTKKYNGFYACYHVSSMKEETIIRSSISLKNGSASLESLGYKYTGRAELIEGILYIKLKGKGHKEYIQIVFHVPLTRNIVFLIGGYSAVTEERNPVIGKMIWHKENFKENCQEYKFDDNSLDSKVKTFLKSTDDPIVIKRSSPFFNDLPVSDSKIKENNMPEKYMEKAKGGQNMLFEK